MTAPNDIRNNVAASRYELDTPAGMAIADYRHQPGALLFTHTEVPPAMKGKGVGSRLIKGALADARRQRLKVVPLCWFVAEYLERHPDEQTPDSGGKVVG